jgi:DNA-binding transcriptional ArsR family regulator
MARDVRAVEGEERVALDRLDRQAVRIGHTPLPTALSLIAEALGRSAHGAPTAWTAPVRAALRRTDVLALLPIFGQPSLLIPDPLVPLPHAGEMSAQAIVERIAAVEPAELLAGAAEDYGDDPPEVWRHAARDPAAWVRRYAVAMGRVLDGLAPLWATAGEVLRRETDRLGGAIAVGAAREVLGLLHPDGRVLSDELVIARPGAPRSRWQPANPLVLLPMIAGPGALVSTHRDGVLSHLGYPLAGRSVLLRGDSPTLDALLGAVRAELLRRLDDPLPMARVAELVGGRPSTATYHVGALELAGLVIREPRGRQVLVARTPRGQSLLALYAV